MTQSRESNTVTIGRLLEAYAKSLAVYYAAEKAFMAEPTTDTAHAYGIAQDRYFQLRQEARHANQLGDALLMTEQNETVGR